MFIQSRYLIVKQFHCQVLMLSPGLLAPGDLLLLLLPDPLAPGNLLPPALLGSGDLLHPCLLAPEDLLLLLPPGFLAPSDLLPPGLLATGDLLVLVPLPGLPLPTHFDMLLIIPFSGLLPLDNSSVVLITSFVYWIVWLYCAQICALAKLRAHAVFSSETWILM